MWKISYLLNLLFTGRRESICASLHRDSPDSWAVYIINRVFSCHENHCQQSYEYWNKLDENQNN